VRPLIAIPIFNERRHVEEVLARVRRFCPDILVVDDGSTDGTSELLARRTDVQLVSHLVNRGYGQSLIDAFEYAHLRGYDWVITMDCDEQHEPESLPLFLEEIRTGQWDLVSGSRYLYPSASDDLPPGDRRVINSTITAVLNQIFSLNLTDAFCGFKAQRTSAMLRLRLDEPGYAFPMQLWPRAVKAGLRITEVPVRLIYNDPSRHFGGALDDPASRLRHYLDVLRCELNRPAETCAAETAVCGCGCE